MYWPCCDLYVRSLTQQRTFFMKMGRLPRFALNFASGQAPSSDQCPLSGVKRTCLFALHMSAYDPKRTLALINDLRLAVGHF